MFLLEPFIGQQIDKGRVESNSKGKCLRKRCWRSFHNKPLFAHVEQAIFFSKFLSCVGFNRAKNFAWRETSTVLNHFKGTVEN